MRHHRFWGRLIAHRIAEGNGIVTRNQVTVQARLPPYGIGAIEVLQMRHTMLEHESTRTPSLENRLGKVFQP